MVNLQEKHNKIDKIFLAFIKLIYYIKRKKEGLKI